MAIERKLYTVADFEAFLAQPGNKNRLFELIEGDIVEKMPTEEHGVIAVNIAAEIKSYLKSHSIGRVSVETRHRAEGDDFNDRLPDISFIARLDRPIVKQGAVMSMPDLAVEIKSPDDTYLGMADTARYYLAHGSRMVWLVYPEKRLVEVLTASSRHLLTDGEMVGGGDVLPDFQMPVTDIFAG